MAAIMRFRKRPVIVSAVRWTGSNLAEILALTDGENFHPVDPEDRTEDPDITAEVYDRLHSTWVHVYDGQWVIKGIRGEFYPIADDVLRETYEPVDGEGFFPGGDPRNDAWTGGYRPGIEGD